MFETVRKVRSLFMMTKNSWRGVAVAVGLLVLAGGCPPAVAGDVNGYSETYLTRALAEARAKAGRSAEQAAATKQAVAAETAELDAETVQAKARLKTLEDELLAASAEANPALLRAVQAEYAATRLQLETAAAWRTLRLKTADEAGRETAAWKRRLAALELGLNLDMRVLLASPAELEARNHGPAAVRKDLEVQASQVRRQIGRARSDQGQALALTRDAAAVRQEPKAASDPVPPGPEAERCGRARLQQLEQLERARQAWNQWYLLSRTLAERARRNGGFLTEELAIAMAYTAALDVRAGESVAAVATAQAEAAEAALAQARQAVGSRQAAITTAAAEAATATDNALAMLAHAATPEARAAAQARLFMAQDQATLGAAEADLMREVVALHKALAAFARDRADQARNELEPKSLADLSDETAALAETARTSAEYVAGFKVALDKLENQVQAARQGLGMTAAAAAPVLAAVNEQAPRLVRSQPGRPELLANRLQLLARGLVRDGAAGAGDAGRRQVLAECLVARQAQRALLADRLGVAETWLAATRDDQAALEASGTRVLWEQRDARLNWLSMAAVLAVAPAVWDDLQFALGVYRLGLARAAGYAAPSQLVVALLFWGLLVAAGIWGTRRLAAGRPVVKDGATPTCWRWLVLRLLPVLPAAAAAGFVLLHAFPGNRLALLLGWGLLGLGGWWCLRTLLLAFCPGHRFPVRATLAGGLLLAVRLVLGAGMWVAVWGGVAAPDAVTGQRHVLFHFFMLFVWLALVRLALHPLLLGRFLSRRSRHRGLRFFGGLAAGAGVLAVMLAVVPFLFSFDNLGSMVLQVTVGTAMLVALAAGLCYACGWLLVLAQKQKTVAGMVPAGAVSAATTVGGAVPRENGGDVLKGLVQAGICLGAALLIAFAWWRLLQALLLAPTAPPAVRDAVAWTANYGRMALALWHYPLTTGVTVRSLTEGLGVFAFFIWLSRVARQVFVERVLVRTHVDDATRATLVTVLGYLVIVLGFLVGMNVAGSSLQSLALLAGAITVGLGFGLQNVVNNFVSSLLILFSRTVRAGDYIDVGGGARGVVREIGFRNTTILTDDGNTVLVPNGSFITANITNWTNPNRATRVHVPLTVTRTADLAEVMRLLTELAARQPQVLRQPAPSVEVRTVAADKISLELLAWTDQPGRQAAILGELALACDRELRTRNWSAG
jgi:small-conductance mechanosensitive channel